MLGTGSNRQAIVARHVTVGGQAPVTAFHRGDFRATLGMILESEILIYDEPTTGLDPITTEMVDDLITEAEEMFGVTSVLISHDMASVVRIADYLNFLHEGRIAASGTPEQLLHTDHPATAEFIRASRITLD